MNGFQARVRLSKIPRAVTLLPFAFLCVAAASVTYFLWVAADRENENAAETSLHLATTALSSVQRDTENWARDYAWWDDTLEQTSGAVNVEWAENNIGEYLRETFGISGSLLLNPDGQTIFASRNEQSYPTDSESLLGKQRDALLAAIQASSMETSMPFSTYTAAGGMPFVVAAAPVTAEHPNADQTRRHPRSILVLYKALDEELTGTLARLFLLQDFTVAIEKPAAGRAYLALRDVSGTIVAYASWLPERPGDNLITSLLPRIAVSAVLLVLGAFLVFYFSWRSANAANRAKSDFLAKISHELRTPLNPIIGFSEVMSGEVFGPLPEKYRDYAKDIHRASRHLELLIEDILDISRIEAGKLSLHEESINIQSLLENLPPASQLLPPSVRTTVDVSAISIEVAPSDSLPKLYADEFRVRQVLLNMLGNAIKHSGTKKIVVRAGIDRGGIQIIVEDFGIGISQGDLAKLFNPFVQLSEAHIRPRPTGSGLGLALSRELMALHGGRLELESVLGKGTQAILSFPPSRTVSDT